MTVQDRRDLAFLILAGLFLGTMGMLNILGLTLFDPGNDWSVADRGSHWRPALSNHLSLHRPHQ